MDRRSLLLGGVAAVVSSVALRAEEMILPEIRQQPVLDRNHLKGFWSTLRKMRYEVGWNPTNDEIRSGLTRYLDDLDVSFPAVFAGKPDGETRVYEITLNGFFEKTREDGCRELYLSISCPQIDHPFDPMFLNAECP